MTEEVPPFTFMACWELREMLGRRANDLLELTEVLEEAPLDSIYYHTHASYLRHRYIAGPYPNDFATWAALDLQDRVLAEQLAVLDPFEIGDLEKLRGEIIATLDHHLSKSSRVPRVESGEPFHFFRSRIQPVPTGMKARSLEEFADAIDSVEASAIYYHVIERRSRGAGNSQGEFAGWVESSLGLADLAESLRSIHPYLKSLERVREALSVCCRTYLQGSLWRP